MILFNTITVLALLPLISANPQNSISPKQNKTKRTISDQIYGHGDAKGVLFYLENPQSAGPELQSAASSPGLRNFYSAPAKPLALVNVEQPIQVFEQDSPKQVAEQQVSYEYQQTPTNAVSNVHVKQLFEPSVEFTTSQPFLYQGQQSDQFSNTQSLGSVHPASHINTANQQYGRPQSHAHGLTSASSPYPVTSATIVSPVHHNTYTNHGLNSASFSYHNPLLPESQQFQNTQISPKQAPGKYNLYLNGKIVYNPSPIVSQTRIPQNSIYHKGVYHNHQKLPLLNYAQRHNTPVQQQGQLQGSLGVPYSQGFRPQTKLTPPAVPADLPPITQNINRFQPPKQLHQIDKPSTPVQQEEAEEEAEQPANEEEEEEAEDDEEDAETENQEDEKEQNDNEYDEEDSFETYPFEEDDYLDDRENHYFKPPKYHKRRGRDHDEEHEYDNDDDQDTKRGSSKQHSKYHHHHPSQSKRSRNPAKYNSDDNQGFYEGYSSNTKYKSSKNSKNDKKGKPSGKYMKVKYSKVKGSKPKVETIEGRFSENIPTTHKQKVFKERWYVSKDVEGAKKMKKMKNIK